MKTRSKIRPTGKEKLPFYFMIFAGLLVQAAAALAQERPAVVQARVQGVIDPVVEGYLKRVISSAESQKATLVVIEMDTPGGLDTSMRQIIKSILDSSVPVAVYVSPPGARAGSAGVFISYAAHVAAMAPNTNIGSAHPVAMGDSGEAKLSEEMQSKITNDAAAYIRSLAVERGRNVDWAEKAVRESANLPAAEAREQNVVDFVATDLADLLSQLDGKQVRTRAGQVTIRSKEAPVVRNDMNFLEAFLHVISDPTIAYILISVGTLGLVFELSNPGAILPGVVGGIALLLGLYSLGTLPVNFAGLLLIAFAFLLFIADLLASTHGVLTIGGLVSFVLGSTLLINVPEGAPFLRVSVPAIVAMTATLGGFFLFAVGAVLRSRSRKVVTGKEGLLGAKGVARTELNPAGTVLVEGELWSAVAEKPPIAPGQQVVVKRVEGLKVVVAVESRL